jgi:Putative adhesin
MNLRSLFAAALTLTASVAFAADGTFDRTLSFAGAPTVSVQTGSGYVHVSPGGDGQLHVVGHVRVQPGWFGGDADARVKQIVASPPIAQSGNVVTIGPSHADSDLYRNVAIDYDVTLPRASTLKAQTGSGGLEIAGVDGAVSAVSGSGEIKAEGIGANARLETGSGSIHALNVRGAANLQTGSGSIELALTGAGDVKAQTGSGSIHIDGLSGGLKAGAGSGSIEVAGTPTAEWRLESGSGGIHMKLGSSARFTLNAETGSGSVQVGQPIVMQGAMNKHHVVGTVNGGGATIRATTGSGDVTIR